MPFDPATLGMQAAGQVVGAGMGLLLQGQQNRNQIKQQRKLQELQVAGQKELTDYNTQKQLEMWQNTSYAAQKEQMIKAGLNPGLMYGMGGGGGQTANIAQGSVSGGNAPSGGGEVGMGMQMMMQLQLLKAQKENIEADTNLKNTDAKKKGGVDTRLGETQIASLAQGITNQQAAAELMELDAQFNSVRNKIANETMNDAIATIKYEMQEAFARVGKMENEKTLTGIEARNREQVIKYQLANIAIDTYLKSEQAKGIQQGVRESIERVSDMINDNMMAAMEQSNRNYQQEMEIQAPDDLPEGVRAILNAIGIGTVLSGLKPSRPNEIRGLHKRN